MILLYYAFTNTTVRSRVVDPDWFKPDSDPAFLLNPDPDTDPDPTLKKLNFLQLAKIEIKKTKAIFS
jgi:hypothetical protein